MGVRKSFTMCLTAKEREMAAGRVGRFFCVLGGNRVKRKMAQSSLNNLRRDVGVRFTKENAKEFGQRGGTKSAENWRKQKALSLLAGKVGDAEVSEEEKRGSGNAEQRHRRHGRLP